VPRSLVSTRTIAIMNGSSPKPFLRWAGSKRAVVGQLSQHAPKHFNRYIEPFVGSGALYFHTQPNKAILSDLNWDVVNLFEQVRSQPILLHELLCSHARDKDTYLAIRANFGNENTTIERAASMLYLNRNCFNGLFRINKSGRFNVPYADNRRGEYPNLNDLTQCAEQLQSAQLFYGDFYDIVANHVAEGDFVYLDPPYVQLQGRIFHEYVGGHFRNTDTDRLGALLRKIHSAGATFLMSFVDDAIIFPIAQEWHHTRILVQRNIAGFASNRRKSAEIIVTNRT